MPFTETVEFLARLQKLNRIHIPVKVRGHYKLETGELLKVGIQPFDRLRYEGFFAKLLRGGRITVPWEVVRTLNLNKPGCMIRVALNPK